MKVPSADHRTMTQQERRALRIVGRSTPPFEHEVQRVKMIEYAQALRLRNPIHWDLDLARKAGFRDIVAAPGFITSLTLGQREAKFSSFGFDERRSLLGEVSWRSYSVVCAGDVLSGSCTLVETAEKSGRHSMDACVVETRVVNQLGQRVMDIRETHLERRLEA